MTLFIQLPTSYARRSSMSETNGNSRTNRVMIAAIIVAGVVALACIVAFAGITIAFFANAPW
jgi:hypothetical protein